MTAVPKLRFPEFEGAGGWEFLNGNKLFNQITNKNHNSDLPILAITQEHGAIPRHLIDYNVVVTGGSGLPSDGADTTFVYAALRDFVDSGRGVVTTGWYREETLRSGWPRNDSVFNFPICASNARWVAQAVIRVRLGRSVSSIAHWHPCRIWYPKLASALRRCAGPPWSKR